MIITGERLERASLHEIFSDGACSCVHWEEGGYCHHPECEDTFATGEHCCPYTGDWTICDLVQGDLATCSFCITPRFCKDPKNKCPKHYAKKMDEGRRK